MAWPLYHNVRKRPFDFKGPGSHYFHLNIAAQTCHILDVSLLTSSNYTGGGTWTTNPVVATPTLSSGKNFNVVVYNPYSVRWMVFGTSFCDEIDANPNSATFATVVASNNVLGSLNGTWVAARIIPKNILVGWASTNGMGALMLDRYGGTEGSFMAPQNFTTVSGQPSQIIFDYEKEICFVNYSTGTFCFSLDNFLNFVSGATLITEFKHSARPVWASIYTAIPICHPLLNDRIIFNSTSNYYEYIAEQFNLVTTFAITGANSNPCFLPHEPHVYSFPLNSLTPVKFNIFTKTLTATLSAITAIQTENGFRLVCIDPNKTAIIAEPYNAGNASNLSIVHVVDPNTDTYVGYVNVGNTAGNILRQHGALNALQNY